MPQKGMDEHMSVEGTQYITPAEIAAWLSVSKMTVYRLIQTGELSAIRVGRSLRVEQGTLDKYIRDNQVDPGALALEEIDLEEEANEVGWSSSDAETPDLLSHTEHCLVLEVPAPEVTPLTWESKEVGDGPYSGRAGG